MTTFPPTPLTRHSDADLPANLVAREDALNDAFDEAEAAFLTVYGASGYAWQMS